MSFEGFSSSLSTLCALVEDEGFELEEHFGPPWSYTANFRRCFRRLNRQPG